LSALDQAIACCGSTLNVADVRSLLGMFGADSLRTVADAVQNADGAMMLEIVSDLERHGQSLQHFCRELSRYWRNLLVSKIAGRPTSLIAASDIEQAEFLRTAKSFSEEDLTRFLSLTLAVYKELQTSLQPRLHMELGLVKLVHAGRLKSIEEAIANLGAPDSAPAGPKTGPPPEPIRERVQARAPRPSALAAPSLPKIANVAVPPKPVAETPPGPATTTAQPSATPAPVEISAAADTNLKQKFYDGLCAAGLQFSADAVMECDVDLKGGELVLRGPKGSLFSLRDPKVQMVATEVAGKPVKVRLEAGAAAVSSGVVTRSTDSKETDSAVRERALEHPGVKRFQELFPDAHVRTVRNLNE
jgi:DNA polymerase-3 subunit gamma/tau